MQALSIKNFFLDYYILKHNDERLSAKDQKIALAASIILGVFSAGLVHLGFAIARCCCFKASHPHADAGTATAVSRTAQSIIGADAPPELVNNEVPVPAVSNEKPKSSEAEQKQKFATEEERTLAQMPFTQGEKRIPIVLTPELITGVSLQHFNKTHNEQLSPDRCYVNGGTFTYFEAQPKDETIHSISDVKLYHQDSGWGCAWRSSINQLNKIREWLETGHLIKSDRGIVNMVDIHEITGFPAKTWIEPTDAAEIFYRFVKKWYPNDQQKILKFIQPHGILFSKQPHRAITSLLPGQVKREATFQLNDLRRALWGERVTDIEGVTANIEASSFKEAVGQVYQRINNLLLTKFNFTNSDDRGDAKHLDEVYTIFATLNIEIEAIPSYWKTLMALVKLYSPPMSSTVDMMDTFTGCYPLKPIPYMIDDGTLARNIYGVHYGKTQNVSHFFIGEPHVSSDSAEPSGNPWHTCRWIKASDVLQRTDNLMMLSFDTMGRVRS